jgi:hypothetical protein
VSNTNPEREIEYLNKYYIIEHQKCVLCKETEHFPDSTHKAGFTDHKTSSNKEKLHTAGTALCTPFSLCYVHMLVLQVVADGRQVMNNIKCGIYSFYVRHNLTVGFPRHCAQYGHYFVRELSAATCCQFTVLTWSTVQTANWCCEVTAESDGR